jgi:hypothetical protein
MKCKIDGCGRVAVARGWCNPHYQSWYHHGDPSRGSTITTVRCCAVDGCQRPTKSDAALYCRLHGERVRRHGDVARERPTGRRWTNPEGYVLVYLPDHPLAMKLGKVFEHRVVLWEKTAGCDQDCFWCGRALGWFARGKARLVTDHLDGNVANNNPANLVASCSNCNAGRDHKPKSMCVHGHALDAENTYTGPKGRECRQCRRLASARYRQREGDRGADL